MRSVIGFVFLFVSTLVAPANSPAAFDSATFNAGGKPLSVTQITPSGEDVPPGRQIVIHFNRPVVPVGRMERAASEIPIRIDPPLECEWRWLNTSSLACQLDEGNALKPATRYRMTIRPGIAAEDGSTLAETIEHSFVTERPKVQHTNFVTWTGPGTPVIRLFFNQPVDGASLASRLLFANGTETRSVAVEPDPDYPNGDGRIWRVKPRREMPLDTPSELRVSPGILPLEGGQGSIEERTLVTFRTFPEFGFLGVECSTTEGKRILISPTAAPETQQMCDPLSSVGLVFNTPVFPSQLREHLKIHPDLSGGREDYDPWPDGRDWSRLNYPSREHRYAVSLPEVLQAYQPYLLKAAAGSISDEFGRALPEPIRMMFFTNHRKPAYAFWHNQAVLEKEEQTEVALVVTNLNTLSIDYTTLDTEGLKTGKTSKEIPPAQDISYRYPLGIRSLLKAPSGVVYGTFRTEPVPIPDHQDRTFFAQVTPWGVHAKAGHYNTLVWVTDLATGKPVPGVTVDIYRAHYPGLQESPAVLASGITGEDGTVSLPGTESLDPKLETFVYGTYGDRLFVRCRLGEDLALLPLNSDFWSRYSGENGSYVWPRQQKKFGHLRAWGTTSQGIYRAGDTVDYKIYVRDQDNRAFVPAPREGYTLEVTDPMGKNVARMQNVILNDFGAFHETFTIPKNGAVGWYRFTLKADFLPHELEPMRVLVSDFTPAPFKVSSDLNGERFRPGEILEVTTSARLHAGGPYADAPARVTVQLTPRSFTAAEPSLKKFYFDTLRGTPVTSTLHQTEEPVDSQGNLVSTFTLPESQVVVYGDLRVESAVRDDRGKFIAAAARAEFMGRDRFVGLRQDDWVLTRDKPAALQVVVVDDAGGPAAGTSVDLKVEYRRTVASRVKGAGNAYLTRFEHRWEEVASTTLTSADTPQPWHFTPAEPGPYRVTATISDTLGRSHSSTFQRWAIGKGNVVWPTTDGYGLQITPEKEEYKVGEKARFLVQNPFPGAQALVTVERFGILKEWVTTLEESTAIVEVDVEPDFMPGFYLSVSLASPRVDQPLGEDEVDLGKPTYRMGYVAVPVRDPVKNLDVKVEIKGDSFKPRETVNVSVSAAPHDGGPLPPVEYAVAVLDESVLDLVQKGTGNWDVYRGFYSLDDLDVANYHLLMRLVGRQKFEKKGANAGGDGGPGISMRTLFKFVSYWNPSIEADREGRANFSFEVPDNLTGWRVLVMAVTPGDRMGLGQGRFKVNRPTELRPALPNQVIEGDRFRAGFTVMNRTDFERTLRVKLRAEGALSEAVELSTEVTAPPYKRVPVWLPVATLGTGKVTFTAKAWDNLDGDALQESLPVLPWSVLETAATYGTTESDKVSERIAVPPGIRTDVGSIGATASPSVVGNLRGAFEYMRDYPYICWEQQLSKGVMASHYVQLKGVLPEDFSWPGAESVTRRTLELAAEHQAPNGGMVYYVPRDEYVSPYLSAYTAIAFNWLRAAGHEIPAQVEARLHGYLTKMLRQEVFPDFYSKGMASTVRAVALAALAPHGRIQPADLVRYRPHLPQMSLFGKAHYLLALLHLEGPEELRSEVVQMILSRANETGGKYVFQEELDGGFAQLLSSTLRDNGAVLSALLAYSETAQGSALGDIPFKLVRTLTQSRGQRDRWENTQENLFCLNALIEYRRIYETDEPQMKVTAVLEGEAIGKADFRAFTDPSVILERPIVAADPGRKMTLELQREGAGRLYYCVRLATAPATPRRDPVNSGIEVRREVSVKRDGGWRLLQSPMAILRGELVRVDLFVSLPAARNFVVVEDPVPGGLEPVNRDLATASAVDDAEAGGRYEGSSFWHTRDDWREYGFSHWSFYHRELRHHAARFYSEYLPAGNYHLSYVAQAIAPGEFAVMATRAEEMYDPDVYGLGQPAVLQVGE